MRAILLLAFLTACASAAPYAPAPSSLPAAPDPFFTQLIDDARPASGQWFSRSDADGHAHRRGR